MNPSNDFVRAIGDFGREFGLENLQPDASGSLCLSIGDGLRLEVQAESAEVLVVLCRSLPFAAGGVLFALLQRCDRHLTSDWVPQLGLVGIGAESELLIIERVPAAQLSGEMLSQAFARLSEWMQGTQELA